MKSMRCLGVASLLVMSAASVATADMITFTYSVTGDSNATLDPITGLLTYSFVPLLPLPVTPLGSLDVRYQGTIDFTLLPPSGPTTTTWSFGAIGQFSGMGLEFAGLPDADGNVPFSGTSVIASGTGIFASPTGMTSYTGSLDPVTGIAMFTERIAISAPGITAVPEPASVLLLGTAAAGLAMKRLKLRGRRIRR
jgi:hypothetical protein